MRMYATVPVNISAARTIRQPRRAQYRIASQRSLRKRFERFILSSDWDERLLCHPGIDRACLGVIASSVLYFVPVLISLLVK